MSFLLPFSSLSHPPATLHIEPNHVFEEVDLCPHPRMEGGKEPAKILPPASDPAATKSAAAPAAATAKDTSPVALSRRRRRRRRATLPQQQPMPALKNADRHLTGPIAQAWEDGVYMLIVGFTPKYGANVTFDVHMTVDMKSDYGYLSAGDYPKVSVLWI